MNKLYIVLLSLGIATIIGGFIMVLHEARIANIASIERRNQNYQECKAKTQDIEWCIKVTKPILK